MLTKHIVGIYLSICNIMNFASSMLILVVIAILVVFYRVFSVFTVTFQFIKNVLLPFLQLLSSLFKDEGIVSAIYSVF